MTAGHHDLIWNGIDDSGQRVASGCYFFRIEADSRVMTTKLTLVK
jgi:hypothetical protein